MWTKEGRQSDVGKKVGEDVTPEDGWIVSETENTITFRYWRMAYYGKRWGERRLFAVFQFMITPYPRAS